METDFLNFARENGYELNTSLELDGKIHRFGRKKSCWYIGWQNFSQATGEKYTYGVLGNWQTGDKHEFRPAGTKISSVDGELIKRKIIEAAKKAEEERAREREEVSKASLAEWENCTPNGSTPYLEKKKIKNLYGARTQLGDYGRELVIPCRDVDGKVWGLQRVFPDGKKLFTAGQKTKETFFVFGELNHEEIYICEGWATGASLFEVLGRTVVCAFNAGNLEPVARVIRRAYPSAKITICGDDDRQTEGNPGRTKAEEAAKAVMGRAVFPRCDGSDFNDMYIQLGVDAVRECFAAKTSDFGFTPLGFDAGKHYYFLHETKSIVECGSFSEKELFEIMPLAYWETVYPGKKSKVDWSSVKDSLISMSRAVGPFDPTKVRGAGVWLDGKKIVVNLGHALVVDGKPADRIKSRYVYIQTKNRIGVLHPRPLTLAETDHLRAACEDLSWRDKKDGFLLAGWIAIARVSGALPIRPHVWLTGSSGSGKSTVMDRVINPCLGHEESRFFMQGGSTEAGVRQSMMANSMPIIFDEFETTGEGSKERVQSLIELLRQSWSHTHGYVVKGSAGGHSVKYALSFAALVSSIRVALSNDADRSRFAVIELGPHGSNQEHWARYVKNLDALTEEYGERLFARSVSMVPVIMENYRVMSAALATVVSQRFGSQYGMLFAGYYSLVSDEPMTHKVALGIIEELGFMTEKAEAEETQDERECLNQITSTMVRHDMKEKTLGELIQMARVEGSHTALQTLVNYGIVVTQSELHVANDHATLKAKVFQNTRWSQNWAKSLARIKGAKKCVNGKSFAGHRSRYTIIPFEN